MLLCSSCHGSLIITHAVEFKNSSNAKRLKDSLVDPWCAAVSQLEASGELADDHFISACIRCDFSSKGKGKGPASFVLPSPLPGASDLRKQKARVLAARAAFHELVPLHPSPVALAESPQPQHGTLTLRGYFFGPSPHTTRPLKPHIIATND